MAAEKASGFKTGSEPWRSGPYGEACFLETFKQVFSIVGVPGRKSPGEMTSPTFSYILPG